MMNYLETVAALNVAIAQFDMSDQDLDHYQKEPVLASILRAHRDTLEREVTFVEAAKDECENEYLLEEDSVTANREGAQKAFSLKVARLSAYRALMAEAEGGGSG